MDEVRLSQTIDGVTFEVSVRASARDFQKLIVGLEPDATGRIAEDLPELTAAAMSPALFAARREFGRSLQESWGCILREVVAFRNTVK